MTKLRNMVLESSLLMCEGHLVAVPVATPSEIIRRGRLFRCKVFHLSAHRDAVGSFNIGFALESVRLPAEVINGAVTRPSLVLCS